MLASDLLRLVYWRWPAALPTAREPKRFVQHSLSEALRRGWRFAGYGLDVDLTRDGLGRYVVTTRPRDRVNGPCCMVVNVPAIDETVVHAAMAYGGCVVSHEADWSGAQTCAHREP